MPTPQQYKKLRDAFISAFPLKSSLEQLLFFELGRNLNQITQDSNLQTVVFQLIQTAESQGWLFELVRAARKENSGNELLQSIGQEFLTGETTTSNLGKLTFVTDHPEEIRLLQRYLEDKGAKISFLKTQEIGNLPITRPDVIVIDFKTADFWESQSKYVLMRIFENFKVIGIGDGGAVLFKQLGLEINKGRQACLSTPSVIIEVPELLQSPFSISALDKVVKVYQVGDLCNVQGCYDEGSILIAGFEGIARCENDQNYWPIARQGNYVIWGFNPPCDQMTDEGKQLFINLLANHKSHPNVTLSQARKKITYIEPGVYSDRLSQQFRRRRWDFQVKKTGTITAELTWTRKEYELMLLLTGQGWERKDGVSPLIIKFSITEDHLLEGTDSMIDVTTFEDLSKETIPFKLKLSFPQD